MLNEAGSLKLEVQIHVGWQSTQAILTCTLGLKEPFSALQFQQNRPSFCISRAPPPLLVCAQYAPMCGTGSSIQQSGRTCNRYSR